MPNETTLPDLHRDIAGVARLPFNLTLTTGANGDLVPAPDAGKRLVIHGLRLVTTGAATIVLLRSGTTSVTGTMGPLTDMKPLPISPVPYFRLAAGDAFNLRNLAEGTRDFDGWVDYATVSA